jgi:hypothetical protein
MSRPELEEELSYLVGSLFDLEAEKQAGDLSGADYERLKAAYSRRQEVVEKALAELPSEAPLPARRRQAPGSRLLGSRRARLVTGWGAFGCFLLAAVFLGLALSHLGPFAEPAGLSSSDRVKIMLAEASELGSSGKLRLALSTYDKVLALEPRQPEALADGGWLTRLAGLSQHEAAAVANGDAEIQAAVRIDPRLAVARAYDGVLLYSDRHEPGLAAAQFTAMLADHASSRLIRSVRSEAVASYRAVGEAIPPVFAAAKTPPLG